MWNGWNIWGFENKSGRGGSGTLTYIGVYIIHDDVVNIDKLTSDILAMKTQQTLQGWLDFFW